MIAKHIATSKQVHGYRRSEVEAKMWWVKVRVRDEWGERSWQGIGTAES